MSESFVPISESFLKFQHPVHDEEDDHSVSSIESDALDQVLDSMFSPRVSVSEDGSQTVQYVSRVPSNRQDALALHSLLTLCLRKYQARETGLCPIRRTLYDRTFDELIRQVTVNCLDQGLLLFRVRNEFRMTLHSYTSMYESCLRFGLRFALHNQKRSLDLEIEKKGMVEQQEDLRKRHFELTKLHEATLGKSSFNLYLFFSAFRIIFV